MKVPEIWRYDGRSLTVHLLNNGAYQQNDRSITLPAITAAEITRFLELKFSGDRGTVGENTLVRQFRQWVRQQQSP
ncbi:MAG: hypothetical protein AAF289_22520 [Cyanobacteria bacterium P01_A01_bin.135]